MESTYWEKHHPPTSPLLADRYLLTMCYSWLNSGKIHTPAVYEFFFRKSPFKIEYTQVCGINETIDWLKRAKFSEDEINFVIKDLNLSPEDPFADWLKAVDFSKLKINAVAEGTIMFPYLPLITLEGPLGVIQLTETLILNKLNFASLIATNARLLMSAIHPGRLFEFGLRRAQGPDGGLTGATYSYIGGASATSNVLAGFKNDVPLIGTMAHSYVTSFSSLKDLETQNRTAEQKKFIQDCLEVKKELNIHGANEGELAAFISFAMDFPGYFVALIDTYHTVDSGAMNFCIVAIALERNGQRARGIRLDSGDLAKLSIDVKAVFRDLGQKSGTKIGEYCTVTASDDLNYTRIKEMKNKHEIDNFAVGTKLITCYEQPALGMVCKLCYLDPYPRLKLSETLEKSTLPGNKSCFRLYFEDGKSCDVIGTSDEKIDAGEVPVFPHQKYEDSALVTLKAERTERLLNDVSLNPEGYKFNVKAMREQADIEAAKFPQVLSGEKLNHHVYVSSKLRNLLFECRDKIKSLSG
jgi:nicotinate phosphoribosyltransferase